MTEIRAHLVEAGRRDDPVPKERTCRRERLVDYVAARHRRLIRTRRICGLRGSEISTRGNRVPAGQVPVNACIVLVSCSGIWVRHLDILDVGNTIQSAADKRWSA